MKKSKEIIKNRYIVVSTVCVFLLLVSYISFTKGTFSVTDDEESTVLENSSESESNSGETSTSSDDSETESDNESIVPQDAETESDDSGTTVKINGERCVKDQSEWVYIGTCVDDVCTTVDGESTYSKSKLRYTGGCGYNGPAVGDNESIRGYRCYANGDVRKWIYVYYCDKNGNDGECLVNDGSAKTIKIRRNLLYYSAKCSGIEMPSETPISYNVTVNKNGGNVSVDKVYYINSIDLSKLNAIVSSEGNNFTGWKIGDKDVVAPLTSTDNGKTIVAQWKDPKDDEPVVPEDSEKSIDNGTTVYKINGERCVKENGSWKYVYIATCNGNDSSSICTTADGKEYTKSVLRYTGGCEYNGPDVGDNEPIRGYRCYGDTKKWVYVYYCNSNGKCLINDGTAKTVTVNRTSLYASAHCTGAAPSSMPISYYVNINANGGKSTVNKVYYINSISVTKLNGIVSYSGKTFTGWNVNGKSVGNTLTKDNNKNTLVAQWNGSTVNNNITVNPQTGNILMALSFVVATVAFSIAFYLFKKGNVKGN